MNNNDFYAITSYFNLFHTKERILNYYAFRKNLKLPLIAIEWAPDGAFELKEGDADILVQIKDGDLMWQKERLLNIALNYLPNESQYVAWLDCDIIFENANWYLEAKKLLGHNDIIQLFEKVIYLPKSIFAFDISKDVKYDLEIPSISKIAESGINLFSENNIWGQFKNSLNGNPGMAYATKVSILKEHQFYDKNIAGGGDLIFAISLHGHLEELFLYRSFSTPHKEDIKKWFNKFTKKKYKSTFLHEKAYHLYHGDLIKRGYSLRYEILNSHEFDPLLHVKMNSKKTWSWNAGANNLANEINQYMEGREM